MSLKCAVILSQKWSKFHTHSKGDVSSINIPYDATLVSDKDADDNIKSMGALFSIISLKI